MKRRNKNLASSVSAVRATWWILKSWQGYCSKNEYEMVADPADADVVLVNTCGFIGPAKEESIETILESRASKKTAKLKNLSWPAVCHNDTQTN